MQRINESTNSRINESNESTNKTNKRIKVLHIGSPTSLYGAERWILALIKHLDPVKIESTVAAIKDSPDLEVPVCREAAKLGFKTKIFESHGKLSFSAITQLRKYIKENNINILHTHFYKTDTIGYLATRGTTCKIITTPHGWSKQVDFKLNCYEFLDRCLFPFLDAVVPLSKDLYDSIGQVHRFSHAIISSVSKTIRSMACTPNQRINESTNKRIKRIKRINESTNRRINESTNPTNQRIQRVNESNATLIKNGIDINEVESVTDIAPEIQRWRNSGAFVIGYIGQLIPRKGLDILFKAAAELKTIDWRLAIVGAGEQEEQLRTLARELSIDQCINFFGYQENRLSFLRGFHTFVLPSRLEGIPRCVMEAMAAEIAVIASDIPGCRDIVFNNRTGLLFELDNIDALNKALQSLASKQESRQTLAANARTFINNEFSANRMAREYEALYHSLSAKRVESTDQ